MRKNRTKRAVVRRGQLSLKKILGREYLVKAIQLCNRADAVTQRNNSCHRARRDSLRRQAYWTTFFPFSSKGEQPMKFNQVHLLVLVGAVVASLTVNVNTASARDSCSSNSDCTAPELCRRYSSSIYADCSGVGRLFGCRTPSGFCSLFCSNEVSFALKCTRTCTNSIQCQQGETCKGSSTQRFCVRL